MPKKKARVPREKDYYNTIRRKMRKRVESPLPDRMLTNPTPVVRNYLAKLKEEAFRHYNKDPEKGPLSDKELISFIGYKLLDFEKARLPVKELSYVYLQRTADEIIRSKKAYFSYPKDAMTVIGSDVSGCNDHAIALMGILRAMGKEPKFAREDTHTMVICNLDGTEHLISMRYQSQRTGTGFHDIKEIKKVQVLPMNMLMQKRIEDKVSQRRFAAGEGPRAIGMMGLSDYGKYWDRNPKQIIEEHLKN